jgi:hypothetical protein
MKCDKCSSFIGGMCGKAQEGMLSDMDTECLLRCQVMLLRDVWAELVFQNDDKDEGEKWKNPDE